MFSGFTSPVGCDVLPHLLPGPILRLLPIFTESEIMGLATTFDTTPVGSPAVISDG